MDNDNRLEFRKELDQSLRILGEKYGFNVRIGLANADQQGFSLLIRCVKSTTLGSQEDNKLARIINNYITGRD